jgi:hypothetical protein
MKCVRWFELEHERPRKPYERYEDWKEVKDRYLSKGDRYHLAEAAYVLCEKGTMTEEIEMYCRNRIMDGEYVKREVMPHTLYEYFYGRLFDFKDSEQVETYFCLKSLLHVPRIIKFDALSFLFYYTLAEDPEGTYYAVTEKNVYCGVTMENGERRTFRAPKEHYEIDLEKGLLDLKKKVLIPLEFCKSEYTMIVPECKKTVSPNLTL